MIFCAYDLNCWQIWASIATVFAALVTAAGMVVIIFTLVATRSQLAEMSKSRSMTAFFEAFSLLENEGIFALRKLAYELTDAPENLSQNDLEKLGKLAVHMQLVAFLVRKKLIHLDDYLELYWNRTTRLWKQLKPFIDFERARRADPTWIDHFEWLAGEATKYHARYYENVDLAIYKTTVANKTLLEEDATEADTA